MVYLCHSNGQHLGYSAYAHVGFFYWALSTPPSARVCVCVSVCLCMCLHACMNCRLKSQNGSTSLIPLSRFTAMLMWDLHQNGWCKAQTEPLSQLESLRNGSALTITHTHRETHNPLLIQSLRLTIFLSQTLLHILELSPRHTCTNTHNTPRSPQGQWCLWPLWLEEKKCWNSENKEGK